MTRKSQAAAEFPSEKDDQFAEQKAQAAKKKKQGPLKGQDNPAAKTQSDDQQASNSTQDQVKKKVEQLTNEDLQEIINADTKKQITDLQKKVDELEDQNLRAQAEIQNMHQRHEKERATQAKYAAQKLGTAILPVVDNLERALDVKTDDEAGTQLHKGVEMVLEHLQQALQENEIKSVGKVGETFDPTVHQAVQTMPADKDHQADTITQVLQKGYCLKDRTIRPAMVIVAK